MSKINNPLIIILNWNGKEDTACCIHSLSGQQGDIVIVDNGSTDGSPDYFKKTFPHCILLETGANLGYAGGNNVGIEYGLKEGYSHFLLLNNDTEVDSHFIEGFMQASEQHPGAGILGAKIYLMEEPTRFDHFGGIWEKHRIDFRYVGNREKEDHATYEKEQELDYVCGAALLVKRDVFEKIGLLDPRFFLFWEETDFCFRARRAGFSILFTPQAKVWHKVSASFTGGKPHATYFFWRNRLLFVEKNFTGIERLFYFTRLLILNSMALWGLKTLRSGQLSLQKLMKKTGRNEERLLRFRACHLGMRDYLKRNFGIGSSTEFVKKK